MDMTLVGVVVLVLALLLGPFAALRAVSHFRRRTSERSNPSARTPDTEKDADKPSGYW
jgi:Na+-transporting methylmalonyl-CoA/oxaloacetate decarboxylase gamma subunit